MYENMKIKIFGQCYFYHFWYHFLIENKLVQSTKLVPLSIKLRNPVQYESSIHMFESVPCIL